MPGTQVFTYVNYGKETTPGTAVAPTRQFYNDGTGVLEFEGGQEFHEEENAGKRTKTRRVTRTTEDVVLNIATSSGVSYDDLIWPCSMLNGTATGTGAGADKTWTQTPSMIASNSPKAYSIDVGDDTQNWRCDYAMFESFKISAARGELTQLEGTMFAQQATKTAKATPAINSGIKIPGSLWTVKFATTMAGLTGASVQNNFLIDFELEVMTGLRWRHYQDGNLFGSQHVETDISGTLTMTVESTALAVSEFVDKYAADTMSFVRLRATGPSLGGSNYSSTFDLPILYEPPAPIDSEEEGVNMYTVTGRLAYDDTSGNSIVPVTVNSLAALP